jgi:DNA-binding MarR family transcriptional regulator
VEAGERAVIAGTAADVRRGATRLARRLRAERPGRGMSGIKIAILAHLHATGPDTPGRIAATEWHQPQSLTRPLAELLDAGYIARIHDDTDRRRRLLSLTEAGRRALLQDMEDRDAWLITALDKLSPLELQILHLGAKIMDEIA